MSHWMSHCVTDLPGLLHCLTCFICFALIFCLRDVPCLGCPGPICDTSESLALDSVHGHIAGWAGCLCEQMATQANQVEKVPSNGPKRFQKVRHVQSNSNRTKAEMLETWMCFSWMVFWMSENVLAHHFSKQTHSALLSISQRFSAALGTRMNLSTQITPPWQRPLPTHWSW